RMAMALSNAASAASKDGPNGEHQDSSSNGFPCTSSDGMSSSEIRGKKESLSGDIDGKGFLKMADFGGENSKDGWYGDYDDGADKKFLDGEDSVSTPPPTSKGSVSSSGPGSNPPSTSGPQGPSAPSPAGKESQDSVSNEEDNGFSGNRPHGKGAIASPSNYCD